MLLNYKEMHFRKKDFNCICILTTYARKFFIFIIIIINISCQRAYQHTRNGLCLFNALAYMYMTAAEFNITASLFLQAEFTINVYSDLACPWCYVGKRQLDIAIQRFTTENPNASITVHWHPYIIDKNTADHGEEYMAYNERRWGGDGWTYSLRNAGSRIGLEFKNWKTWPNTVHGHRLVHIAGQQKGPKGQNMAEDVLFRMIYEDGKNISDMNTLIEAAHELEVENAEGYLNSNQDVDVIMAEDAHAKSKLNISGVPYFIVQTKQGKRSLSGAQSADNFLKAFNMLKS